LSLGYIWALARPVAMVFIFTFIKNKSGANLFVDIAYPLYIYSGIILWFHFRDATMAATKSVMKDAGVMKRIYYPRLISPMVPVLSNLHNLAIAALPLIVMMFWYGVFPGWRLVLLPMVLLQCSLLILGLGLIFACLTILKPDFEKFLNLCLYLGLFVSPVIFSPELIPEKARALYFINPMAGTLLAFRSCLFHPFPFPAWQFLYSGFLTLTLLALGIRIFRRTEAYLVDAL
jgi:lipopolysaccharide transport system permease protein